MKKRLLAVLLSFTMVFSMLPTAVYAEDTDTAKTQSDSQEEAPDKIVVGTENGETDQEDPLKLLQDRIWALPDVEEFEAAEADQQNVIYLEAQAIAEEYEQLSAEDQERLDVTRLMEMFDYFNSLVEELNGSNCRTNGDTTMNLLTQTDNTLHLYAEWNHAHIWQYGASGDTITATCAGGGECPYKDSWPTTVLDAEDVEYSGSVYNKAQIVKNEITDVTGAAASGITYVGQEDTEYAESANAPTSAGKYTAKVSVGGVTAVKDFEITKAPSDANVTFAEGLAYNGKNQYLVERTTTVGGTLMYRLSDAEEWQAGLVMLSKKGAGDYTIQYYVKGDANHNDSEVKTATVTIQQKELTVSGVTIQDKVYDGNTNAKVASDCTPAVNGLLEMTL